MFNIRGIQLYDGRWNNPYDSAKGRQAIDELVATIPHCNYLYLDVWMTIDSIDNVAWTNKTALEAAINYARTKGLKIAFRCMTYNLTDLTFLPVNAQTFFINYTAVLEEIATYAQSKGVEVLGIGTELEKIDTYQAEWNNAIAKVRAKYNGKVFYTTNFFASQAQFDKKLTLNWFKNLDYLCVSAYFPLTATTDFIYPTATGGALNPAPKYIFPATPDVNTLKAAYMAYPQWGGDSTKSFKGSNVIALLQQLSEAIGKKLIFHMGLGSYHSACATPWSYKPYYTPAGGTQTQKPIDLEGQKNMYQAFFEVFSQTTFADGWLLDGAWLTIPLAEKSGNNVEFSIQNKPAAPYIEFAYENLSPPIEPSNNAGLLIIAATIIAIVIVLGMRKGG